MPLWEEDESRQAIVLTSFVAISDALRTAQDQFLTDAAQNAPALQVYQFMNGYASVGVHESYGMSMLSIAEIRLPQPPPPGLSGLAL